MKLKNISIQRRMKLINAFILFSWISVLLITILPIYIVTRIVSPYILFTVLIVLTIGVIIRGNQYYDYDSAGEVFSLKTYNIGPLSFLFSKDKVVDFPKSKILDYHFSNGLFFKQLTLTVQSRKVRKGVIHLKFKMSYLNQNEVKLILNDLDQIIENNKISLAERLPIATLKQEGL
ncbi:MULTISPECIES: hypothetical protein [Weeksella]|uniref:Uncharacterized protein n=1 Tax=Weeksella virosa (strain ATCC 43766 / DSM 16922 / JCM 21250 / CCUG 30538 / CDC 9751 / IAM 14551 / NBRC 16016 / NCTC 11634 / CL345/78) TaxID=865938 RepID=F0NXV8_WEEVC|nr:MULTISPECIES: hypothetical protein [Weeksella]ADX68026.1 hypothetical protein Weevi_1322 [Weeksella virosa DSM 16922]MDK7375901.1 hypothetical protein [Weeksella virosa]MDK7676204.1 hypothetical protein [Weeksella virosa]OFM83819.1 hypothetical protein HMPREF2660_09830 [Weeksella sp. HMSC059D05]SUP54334.1 Uncharacterised protein [Weeksella virosa]